MAGLFSAKPACASWPNACATFAAAGICPFLEHRVSFMDICCQIGLLRLFCFRSRSPTYIDWSAINIDPSATYIDRSTINIDWPPTNIDPSPTYIDWPAINIDS
jgi:hypothetical protein